MPPDTLEFEEPIARAAERDRGAVDAAGHAERQRSHRQPERADRLDSRRDLQDLTPWQRVLVARHPNRPTVLDYVNRLFTEFTEISGDRRFADDHAIVAGFARYKGEPVLVVGHHKGGGDTKQKIFRNFGYARPEGYRKALRAMKLAEKFRRPSSRSSTRRPRIRASSRRSAASPKRSRSTCARWRRSTRRSSSSCTAKAAAAARSAWRSATAS